MLTLPAHLTLREARKTLRELEPAIGAVESPTVTLDAGPLLTIDSSALAVLLECRRMAELRQRRFEVVNAPSRLAELAHLYGVDELLSLQRPAAST